jgi:hypothetical protein
LWQLVGIAPHSDLVTILGHPAGPAVHQWFHDHEHQTVLLTPFLGRTVLSVKY